MSSSDANAATANGDRQRTVFVVDDDIDIRNSIEMLLTAAGYTVRSYPEPTAFLAQFPDDARGCLLFDVRMPNQTGIELYQLMLRRGFRLPVVFITAHADVDTALAAMKTGAIEFLEKPFDRVSLLRLVEKGIRLDALWQSQEDKFQDVDERIGRLNRRDRETLEFLIEGLMNKQIAAKLEITERAVEMRRSSLLKKLGVGTTAELLELAITHRVLLEVREAAKLRAFCAPGWRNG